MSKSRGLLTPLFFALAVIGLIVAVFCFYKARALETAHSEQQLLVSGVQQQSAQLQVLALSGVGVSTLEQSVADMGSSLQQLERTLGLHGAGNVLQTEFSASAAFDALLPSLWKLQEAANLESLALTAPSAAPSAAAAPVSSLVDKPAVPTLAAPIGVKTEPPQPPDFEKLIHLSSNLRESLQSTEAPEMQAESAGHLFQLAISIDKKVLRVDDGMLLSDKARGPWMVFDQILKRMGVMVEGAEITDPDAIDLLDKLGATQSEIATVFDGSFNESVQQFLQESALAKDSSSVATEVSASEAATQAATQAAEAAANEASLNADQTEFAKHEMDQQFQILNQALEASEASLASSDLKSSGWFTFGLMTALLSAGMLALLALGLWRQHARDRQQKLAMEQGQQASILRLLDEISALAEGDLETRATVSEDMTGAIADSFNFAVGELRRLVGAINQSADRVNAAVEDTGATAQQLASASAMQSREISRSSSYLQAMSDTMGQISKRSAEAVSIATRSLQLSNSGKQAVDSTVSGVQTIEVRTSETLKMLKRLGDSSDQIGRAIVLMNEVAERTELLAMNAAIQSRSATPGIAGSEVLAEQQRAAAHRQSARVADQVKSLANSLNHTSFEIESQVTLIRRDIADSIISMQQTVAEVEGVSSMSRRAGECLSEIEQVSERLSVVVEHLGSRTARQSEVVTKLSSNMGVINEVTRHSSHGLRLSAAALDDLKLMSTELRDSVSDFSLPAGEGLVSGRTALSRRGARVLGQNPARRGSEAEVVEVDMDSDMTQVLQSSAPDTSATVSVPVERDS